MATGYLTDSSLPPPADTCAIDTARNKYIQTPCNTLVRHILQASPKIQFSYADTHSTIQAVHSLVPWSNPTGAHHLLVVVGAHTDSIQAEALMSFPAAVFNTFAISITPKKTLSVFRTWIDATLLPDGFTNADDPASPPTAAQPVFPSSTTPASPASGP
eukprot:jgi/Psemu1/13719/gm1.13719_g